MPFTWEAINRDWLAGDELAAPSTTVENAFNRLEIAFGPEWVKGRHSGTGAIPTLPIAVLGHTLGSLDGLSNSDKLIEALRQLDASAWAEATAIHIVRSFCPGADIELFPNVPVGGHIRQPDFRARTDQQEWTVTVHTPV